MSSAFKQDHIQAAFRATGHIDAEGILPSIKNMIGTYRGVIDEEHYLNDSEKIIKTFYDEVYLNGRIEERRFDDENVVRDYDSKGNYVSRDFDIIKENCQRSKNLSCQNQRDARIALMESIKLLQQQKQTSLFDIESKKYTLNEECIERVCNGYYAILKINQSSNTNTVDQDTIVRKTFIELIPEIKECHFGRNNHKGISKYKPTMEHMKAFIQLRNKVTKYQNNKPLYKKVDHLKKDELIDECILHIHLPVQPRLYEAADINEEANTTPQSHIE